MQCSILDLEAEYWNEAAHGLAFLCPTLLPLTTRHLLSICVEYVAYSSLLFRKITNNNNAFIFSEADGGDSRLTCWWIQQNTFEKYYWPWHQAPHILTKIKLRQMGAKRWISSEHNKENYSQNQYEAEQHSFTAQKRVDSSIQSSVHWGICEASVLLSWEKNFRGAIQTQ